MQSSDVCVLGSLLRHVRKLDAERVRAVISVGTRGESALFGALASELHLTEDEAQAFVEAARFLVSGRHVRVCARCQVQFLTAAEDDTCPQCKGRQQRGVLASPKTIQFDPALESKVRRMIHDSAARHRAQMRVAEVRRLRETGQVGARPEADVAPNDKSCTGSTLGAYRLQNLVGRGGSSWVYRAEDTRTGKVVALKVFYVEERTSPTVVQERMARFRREAELAGALDHPNLVPVGPLEQDGSWYFMSMPFIDGPSLAHVLEARATSAGGADFDRTPFLIALAEIARGLHYAHCRGVVHRDVSPRNILFDQAGQVYLSDFGAAKSLDVSSTLTVARTVVGTLAYAAPERLQSESKAEARSDVYSLGVILYEILTGTVPYRENQVALLLAKILKEGPPAPRSIRPDLPADLETLALKALQADPAKRPESALAFAHELTACVELAAGITPSVGGNHGLAGETPRVGDPRRAFALGALVASVVALVVVVLIPSSNPSADLSAGSAAYMAWSAAHGQEREALRTRLGNALEDAERFPVRDESVLRVWQAGLAWGDGRCQDVVPLLTDVAPPSAWRVEALRTQGLAAYFLTQRYGSGAIAGRFEAVARQAFSELLELEPQSYDGRLAHAFLLLMGNDLDGAYAYFYQLNRDTPERSEAPMMEVWTALLGGADGVAETVVKSLGQRFAGDPWVLLLQGLVSVARNSPTDALEIARRLRSKYPAMVEAAILQSSAALATSKIVEAEASARAAIQLDPLAPGAHRLLAAAIEAREDLCVASSALTRAVELDPDADGPVFHLAALLLRHGMMKQAREAADDYLKRFPKGEFAEAAHQLAEQE